jgi:hypothetical protein
MSKVKQIMDKVDAEANRVANSPEELKLIDEFKGNIGNEFKPIYGKLTRKVFHDFLQCCKHEGVTIGEKFTSLCEEYAGSNFPGKKPYDPQMDWKAKQARNSDPFEG